jgi:hypothetical protein
MACRGPQHLKILRANAARPALPRGLSAFEKPLKKISPEANKAARCFIFKIITQKTNPNEADLKPLSC